ncbi:helix-turn-helix domain-containing protein [Nocardia sp. NPDC050435]|uniref:helix-turn-helix domain-containing protein n=1 Tax=Nocardia sp. NPDC050435 TaxID=3155040 RepID=UPI0033C9C92F
MSLPQLYTAEQVADALHLESPAWLEDSARSGTIAHVRLGRRLRFSAKHVESLIAANEKGVDTPLPKPAPRRTRGNEPTTAPQPRRLQARVPARMRNL